MVTIYIIQMYSMVIFCLYHSNHSKESVNVSSQRRHSMKLTLHCLRTQGERGNEVMRTAEGNPGVSQHEEKRQSHPFVMEKKEEITHKKLQSKEP